VRESGVPGPDGGQWAGPNAKRGRDSLKGKHNGKGLIEVYTGDGKGKTTAAIGLAIRAAGWGHRVLIVQFLKHRMTGEFRFLDRVEPLIEIIQVGSERFVLPGEDVSEARELAEKGLALAREAIASGHYQLVVLDEVIVALDLGVLCLADVLQVMKEKPEAVELVLTGRGAPVEIEAAADLVTHMQDIKHPYHQGIEGRKGIDF